MKRKYNSKNRSLWAVVPAHNEQDNISKIVKKAAKYVDKVLVVDDGSRDKTKEAARKSRAIVLRHIINLGKGATLKTGCDYAIKNGATHIIVLDADAQHNPDDIPRFIEKLEKCDIVFSFRKLSGRMPLVLRFGNWVISRIVAMLFKLSLKDTQSGFRAFTSEAYKRIRWSATDYSMESEMIAKAGKQKLKYVQIPIQTVYTDKYKGTTVLDGIKIVFNMLLWKLIRRNGA